MLKRGGVTGTIPALAQRAEAGRTTPVDETRFEEQLRALGYVE